MVYNTNTSSHTGSSGIRDGKSGHLRTWLDIEEAEEILNAEMEEKGDNCNVSEELQAAISACKGGVNRVHMINGRQEGSLLAELYTLDGVGTMVSANMYEGTREARDSDVEKIMEILAPLEQNGTLIKRTRERLLEEVRSIVGCVSGVAVAGA